LFEIIDRCAHADDALRQKEGKSKVGEEKKSTKRDAPESSKKRSRKSGKRKSSGEVLAAEQTDPPRRPNPQNDDSRKQWCPIHKTNNHATEDCFVFKMELARQLAIERGKRVRVVETAEEAATNDSDSAFPEYNLHVSHIFGGSTSYTSKREYKKVEHEVWSTSQAATAKMKWSQHKIEFTKADHPKIATTPGRYPIVVEPTIRNIKVAQVLIDGGSPINLLFASTLDVMGIPRSELTPTYQPFHVITPE
jgi:hypothetical protein